MARPPPSHRQALKTMPKVAKLNLRNNCCRNQGVEALGASAARDGPCARAGGHDRVSSGLLLPVPGEYLKTNSTLVELNINENNLGDEGAKALAEGLKANETLKVRPRAQSAPAGGGVGPDIRVPPPCCAAFGPPPHPPFPD